MSKCKPFNIHLGDCLEVLKTMADSSVHSIVTDPPYGLKFMGKKWDCDVPCVEVWEQCLRVLKPGGHLLAFAGTRTQHRMAARIEDAGFEIRDMIAWVYGSGFPKSLDVSKAIDKAAGALAPEGKNFRVDGGSGTASYRATTDPRDYVPPAPATPEAQQWAGWGTALKPALEPITMARKPLTGTVSSNVLEHGTGVINVDGCRVKGQSTQRNNTAEMGYHGGNLAPQYQTGSASGRWPANLIHDGSDEVVGLFPQTGAGHHPKAMVTGFGDFGGGKSEYFGPGPKTDKGSAARFFYCAKASKADREERNKHPTVKPAELMRYLCRLVTPPKGFVLDPFMGSGSTGKAAIMEGFSFIGIERESKYVEIAKKRIGSQVDLFSRKGV